MRTKLNAKWLISGAIALGLAACAPMPAQARDEGRVERPVSYDDLPRAVKKFFDEEKGRVHQGDFVFIRNGKGEEFYRGVVDEGSTRRLIRVSPRGDALGEDDVKIEKGDRPRETVDRNQDRESRDWEGWDVDRDDIPRHAWRTVEEHAGRDRILSVREVYYHGLALYRVTTGDRSGERVMYVSADGTYYGGRDDVVGHVREIGIEDAPRVVREALSREAGAGRVRTLLTSRRDGVTIFSAVIEHRRGTDWVTVDEGGRVLSHVDR